MAADLGQAVVISSLGHVLHFLTAAQLAERKADLMGPWRETCTIGVEDVPATETRPFKLLMFMHFPVVIDTLIDPPTFDHSRLVSKRDGRFYCQDHLDEHNVHCSGKKFTKNADALRHIETCHLGKRFACPFEDCDAKASQRSHLTGHFLAKHKLGVYECEACSHRTPDQSAMRRHCQSVHGNYSRTCRKKTSPKTPDASAGQSDASTTPATSTTTNTTDSTNQQDGEFENMLASALREAIMAMDQQQGEPTLPQQQPEQQAADGTAESANNFGDSSYPMDTAPQQLLEQQQPADGTAVSFHNFEGFTYPTGMVPQQQVDWTCFNNLGPVDMDLMQLDSNPFDEFCNFEFPADLADPFDISDEYDDPMDMEDKH